MFYISDVFFYNILRFRLLLRICPIEDHNAYVKFHGVFGCNEEDVKFLLRSAKQLGLNIIGVS